MTFMLGSVCSDGVVLVGDRKVSWGNAESTDYMDKILADDAPMAAGFAGNILLFKMFREQAVSYFHNTRREKGGVGLGGFLKEMEDIMDRLHQRYILQQRTAGGFDALVALDMAPSGVRLYKIHQPGVREEVAAYRAVGSGEPYVRLLLKQLWRPDMTMMEAAVMGYFLIRVIEAHELDPMVGIGERHPQVWFLPHSPFGMPPRFADAGELRLMRARADAMLGCLGDAFSALASTLYQAPSEGCPSSTPCRGGGGES